MKNKTRRISRILPAILAVMLCVTVFPFARHGRALAGESPEHAQVVGNV